MAGLNIELDLRRKNRDEEAASLAQKLLEGGASPDVANQVARTYARTGQFELPQFQTTQLPPTNLFPEGIPIRQPAVTGSRKALYGLDVSTGKFTEAPVPSDVSSFMVEKWDSGKTTQPVMNGENIYVDARTGDEIRREKNGTKLNKVIKVGTAAGTKKDTPDVTLAKKFLADLQKDIDEGIPIDPDRMATARTAAQLVGNVDVGQEPDLSQTTEPGKIAKFFGAQPTTTVTPGKPFVKYGQKGTIPTPAGKPLTKELAQRFLQQYGGNKEAARKAAREAGYSF